MWRLTSMTLTAILALGVAGNVMEPQWEPQQYDVPAQFTAVPEVLARGDRGPAHDTVTDDIAVSVQGEQLEGLVYSPAQPGRFPAVVFLHGAGTKDRTGFHEQAEHLAASGIVALVLDRRTEGYSTWDRDYKLMADDALAGVTLLRDLPNVDPDKVGLFGESEGTWVAPVAAAKDPDIAFMVMISAPIVPPAQQATYATLMALESLNAPSPVQRAVAKGIGLAMTVPNLFEYASFDVLPYLEQTDQPIFMAFGTEDAAVPIVQAAELAATANPNVSAHYFDGAQHAIRIGDEFGPFAEGYLESLSSWIHAAANGTVRPGQHLAGAVPEQTLSASAVPDAPWYATTVAHIVALGLAVAGYFAGPIARWLFNGRGKPEQRVAPTLRRRLRWLRLTGVASLATLVTYFWGLSHLALNHQTSPVVTYGLWAGVWIVTATAVVALLNLWLDKPWRGTLATEVGDDYSVATLNRVEQVALTGAVGGTGVLLMIVTYWGVFLGV